MYCIHLYTIYRNHHWSYKSMGPWGFLKSFWSPTGRRCGSQYQATERTSDWAPRSCVKDCIICSKALLAADTGGKWLHPMDSYELEKAWWFLDVWWEKGSFTGSQNRFLLRKWRFLLSWTTQFVLKWLKCEHARCFCHCHIGVSLRHNVKSRSRWFAGWSAGNSQKGWPLEGKMMVSNTKTGIQETRVVLGSAVPVVSW